MSDFWSSVNNLFSGQEEPQEPSLFGELRQRQRTIEAEASKEITAERSRQSVAHVAALEDRAGHGRCGVPCIGCRGRGDYCGVPVQEWCGDDEKHKDEEWMLSAQVPFLSEKRTPQDSDDWKLLELQATEYLQEQEAEQRSRACSSRDAYREPDIQHQQSANDAGLDSSLNEGCTPGDDHVREENSSSGYDKSSLAAVQIEPEQESVHTQHVADLDVARNPQLRRELSQNLRKVRTSIDANAAVGSVLNEVRSRADEELCDQDWSASSNRHVDSGNWRKVRDGVDANAAFGSLLNEVRSRADEQMYDQDWNLGLEKGPSPPAPPQLQEEVSAIDCDESADDDTGTIQSVCTATRTKWDKVRAGVHAGAAFGSLLNEVRSREDEQLYDRDWSSGSRRSSRWSTVRASVHANAALCSALSDARSREDEQLYEQDWTCVAHNPIPREDSNASVGDHKLSL